MSADNEQYLGHGPEGVLPTTLPPERGSQRFWGRMIGVLAAGSGICFISLNAVVLAEGLLRGMPIDEILSSPLPDFHARINPWLPISSGLFYDLGAVVSIGISIAGIVAADRLISRLTIRRS